MVEFKDAPNTSTPINAENLNKLQTDMQALIPTYDEIRDKLYPIGSIYLSVNSADPSDLFGGTWEQLKDKFLLGAGDTYEAGSTGGEAEHTLTVDEMPSHSHQIGRDNDVAGGGLYGSVHDGGVSTAQVKVDTSSTGGSQAHNNMPPYLTVYMWKRTA